MTASYHLLLPCPNGRVSNDTIRLTVFVVPRLQAVGPLTDWSTDWRNWPTVLNGPSGGSATTFDVLVNGTLVGANTGLGPADWTSPAPDPAVWDAVFGTASGGDPIGVRRFSPVIRTGIDLHPSYDPRQIESNANALHDELARSPLPPRPGDLAVLPEFQTAAGAVVNDEYRAHVEPTVAFDAIDLSGEPTPVEADFHDSLAFLQAHPELMRHLGLAIDLEVRVPAPSFGDFTVAVGSSYNRADGTAVPIEVNVGSDGWPVDGPGTWAPVGDGSHGVSQLDPSSTVLGLASIERSLTTAADDPSVDIPLLADVGIGVSRSPQDLADELDEVWTAQAAFEESILDWFEAGATDPVPAPGLLLTVGLRYDVWDEDAADWFSLWDREVPDGYVFPRDGSLDVTPDRDEGWITPSGSTESASALGDAESPRPGEGQPLGVTLENTRLRLSPWGFVWNGWSLAARQPGRAFSGLAGPIDPAPNEPGADPDTGDEMLAQATIDYEVPTGVLPRLRYTHRYKFRGRTVDVAGNSRPLAARHPGGDTETALVEYGRQSAIGAPLVVRRQQPSVPGWGDVVDTLVVKSELDQRPDTIVPASRVVFPARTGQQQCEVHGFPGPDGLPTSQAVFDDLVARSAASVFDQTVSAPGSGDLVIAPVGSWGAKTEYLVEPAQSGYAFHDLPGTTGPTVVSGADDWPNAETTSIELRGGDAGTVVDTAGDEADVIATLPPGCILDVSVSATIDETLRPHWKRWQRMSASDQAALADSIRDGEHWMFSSKAAMRLVHAVRQPLVIPAITAFPSIDRDLRVTWVDLGGQLTVDVKSTDRVLVRGSWTDPIDTPGAVGGVEDRRVQQLLFQDRFPYAETSVRSIGDRAQLGDTRRHDALLSVEAFSRYARYFTERSIVAFDTAGETVELAPEGVSTQNIEVTFGGRGFRAGTDFEIDGAAGTITQLADGDLPLGSNVVVDFIRRPVNRWFDEDGSAPFPIVIPNSAVPAPIDLVEAWPAFSRTQVTGGADGPLGVEHLGQTIRVWLGRPWFTTGRGELLGVLPAQSELARDAMSPSGVERDLTVADFPAATTTMSTTAGMVAGHEVAFDEDRQLWYADVSIAGEVGYRPFIRFALCRCQPESIGGAHVGPAFVTEPIRLGANRTSTIERSGDDVTVVVVGEELGNRVTAFLQESDPDIADPDLRWNDLGDAVELLGAPDAGGTRWTGSLTLPDSSSELRVVIEDAELLTSQREGGPQEVIAVAYIETIDVPAGWYGSTPTTTTTIPGGPGAVGGVTARGGDQRALVSWEAPVDNGNPLTRYRLEQLDGSGGWVDVAAVPATRTRHVVRGLVNGTEVTVRVRAESNAGNGPWSPPVAVTPNPQVPGRVRRVRTFSGAGLVRIGWRSAAARGAPVTGYVVEQRTPGGEWGSPIAVPAASTDTTIEGLTPDVTVGIRVRAENTVGAGAWSEPATVTVSGAGTVPAQVHGVTLTAGDRTLVIDWLRPADGGAVLVRYELELRGPSGSVVTRSLDANQLAATVGGLTNGDTYAARVRAVNLIGAGPWSIEGVGVPTP